MYKIFLMLTCLFSTASFAATTTPLSIEFKLNQDTFTVGEPVNGKIILQNTHGNFPTIFEVRLYHGSQLFTSYIISFQRIFFGRTEYSFKDFNVPRFNDTPAAVGEWHISIAPQGMDTSAYTTIYIENP
jgi:hypothetical protein